jgi:hypothetical protein
LFLSRAEFDYLTAKRQFSDDYDRVIKSRLQKELELFVNHELPILIETAMSILQNSVTTTTVMLQNTNATNGKTSKNGLNHSQIGASSNFHAPWSGSSPELPSEALLFHNFLIQTMNEKSAQERIRYVKNSLSLMAQGMIHIVQLAIWCTRSRLVIVIVMAMTR